MADVEQSIIYVVDDEPAVPEFVGQLLLIDNRSYHVECFGTAAAALARMAVKEPCVLVTDIWMPGTGGIDLLKQCRDRYPEVEVILITAQPSVPTAIEAFEHEAFAYLEKPFHPDQLKTCVRRALAKRRMLRLARAQQEKSESAVAGPDLSVAGAGSFFAAAWEYLPGEALVLDASMRIVSANRAARVSFNLGRRVKPRLQDIAPLGPLLELARRAETASDPPGPLSSELVDGRPVRASWSEFMDGVKFCVVWFAAKP